MNANYVKSVVKSSCKGQSYIIPAELLERFRLDDNGLITNEEFDNLYSKFSVNSIDFVYVPREVYKVRGEARKKLSKELNKHLHMVKDFWMLHGLDSDMYDFFGGQRMSDEDAEKLYDSLQEKINNIRAVLSATEIFTP